MKKSLLALAAMGAFVGAAQAQSSVSVYGVYDGGLNLRSAESTTAAGVVTGTKSQGLTGNASASSRLGFRGTEDLGKGNSANFNLELGFNPGTGEVTTATRDNTRSATGLEQGSETGVRTATVGLASKELGELRLGRALTGMHGIVAGNVWGGNNMVGDITYSDFRPNAAANAGGTTNVGQTPLSHGGDATVNAVSGRASFVVTRSSNMASYFSPRIAGFQLRADVGNTNSTTAGQPNDQFAVKGAYLNYVYGPITANIGTIQQQSNNWLAATTQFTKTNTTVNAANIMYQAKGLTVQYTYAGNEQKTRTATTDLQASQVKANKLSASYQFGAVMPFVQYGMGTTQGAQALTAVNNSTDDKALQVGAEYGLSKRTNLYAAYGDQERTLVGSPASLKITQYAVGLRHTF